MKLHMFLACKRYQVPHVKPLMSIWVIIYNFKCQLFSSYNKCQPATCKTYQCHPSRSETTNLHIVWISLLLIVNDSIQLFPEGEVNSGGYIPSIDIAY